MLWNIIAKKSPRQKRLELGFIKTLNKTAPGSEKAFFELWKTGKVDAMDLIEFRNFYTMQGEKWGYQTGYQEGWADYNEEV